MNKISVFALAGAGMVAVALSAGGIGWVAAQGALPVGISGLAMHHESMSNATDHQQMIHERGAAVMPFDLNQTLHHFESMPDGGLETVTANDPANQAQRTLIQQHLAIEAQRFQRGDFTDPAALHGADMPGLAVLSAAGTRLRVAYNDLPNGGQIRFTTQDATTLTAVHDWFTAQLSEHGRDAVAH